MTKPPRKNVPDVGIELGAACMPSELASDRATAPGRCLDSVMSLVSVTKIPNLMLASVAEQAGLSLTWSDLIVNHSDPDRSIHDDNSCTL